MRHFSFQLALRIVAVICISGGCGAALVYGKYSIVLVSAGLLCWFVWSLFYYVTGANRKLTRFFDAVRFSDFSSTFRADNPQGESFRELNQELNSVMDAFRQARAEKEANWQYLNAIVQHVSVGLLAYSPVNGAVEWINPAAQRLLGGYRLRNLDDLPGVGLPQLAGQLRELRPGISILGQLTNDQPASIAATDVRIRGRLLRLVSLQNIRSEMQQKEVDAWQNLARVLRHEIMNSLTPIIALTNTMRDIVENPIPGNEDDLKLALDTIERRTQGLVRFVDSYRSLTNLPGPRLESLDLAHFLERVGQLLKSQIEQQGVAFVVAAPDRETVVMADADQLEMALINLLKNALEALQEAVLRRGERPVPTIRLEGRLADEYFVEIAVIDNGPGIPEPLRDEVFVPFFTTKTTGTGIGLSVCRQIVQAHNGEVQVRHPQEGGTVFVLRLPFFKKS